MVATTSIPKSAKTTTKITELEVINYERLSAKDENEIKKLVYAASSRDIFFLDTNGPSAALVTSEIPQILEAQRKFFNLPLGRKQVFERSEPERGYRPNMETLLLSREEELNGRLELPSQLQFVSEKLANVSNFTDSVSRDMYRILCSSVVPEDPGVALIPEHADNGLITLLYYDMPSLEILEPTTRDWDLVQRRPGLQVVYIGNHISAVSGDHFKAAAHRVVNLMTGWALVVYLLHPGLDQVDDPNYSR